MKKLFTMMCFCLMLLCSTALAEIDLESMSFDELMDLQASIEEEVKTRNINKLDFSSLRSEELEQFIVKAIQELCSREEYVFNLSQSAFGKRLTSMYGNRGVHLTFHDTKENWYYIYLTDENIEVKFKTRLEQTIEEAAQLYGK